MSVETRADIEKRIRNAVRKNFTREVPPEGLYQFVITSARVMEQPSKGDKDGNGAGCKTIAVNVAPLATADDLSSVQPQFETVIWATVPTVNPDIEGHTVDANTTSKWTALMAAFVPDRVPFVSAKLPNGEWDNTPETKAKRINAQIEATVLATEILEGSFKLGDLLAYGTAKPGTGEGRYFVNSLTSELKPGQKLGKLSD